MITGMKSSLAERHESRWAAFSEVTTGRLMATYFGNISSEINDESQRTTTATWNRSLGRKEGRKGEKYGCSKFMLYLAINNINCLALL